MNLLHGDLHDYWNYILGGVDLVGIVALRAVGKKKAVGWLWAMFTQALWIVYSLATLQPGFLVPAVIKFGIYTWNYVSWVRSDRAEAKPKTAEDLARELAAMTMPNANELERLRTESLILKAARVGKLYHEQGAKPA